MADIRLVDLTKKFRDVIAVDRANLEILDREFIVIVGASGCGKTTTLRMIAGLERPTSGDIYIGGARVNDLHPKDRDVSMVFQNYALYPHMNVFQNMAFGLKLRKYARFEIESRVHEAARMLGLDELLDRKPKQLSGGQRQRVAMGRAMVRSPKAFLFDEPLSNLDAKMRVEVREELLRIHQKVETTMVYVTHDQVEAMTLADRIVLMNEGRITQVGSPMELYTSPKDIFVAGFIGSPAMNMIDATIMEDNGTFWIYTDGLKVAVPPHMQGYIGDRVGKEIVFGIRPEHIYNIRTHIRNGNAAEIRVVVDLVETIGAEIHVVTRAGRDRLKACLKTSEKIPIKAEVSLFIDMAQAHLFEKQTGIAFGRASN